MKNSKIYSKTLAVLMAGGISLTFTGCNEKEQSGSKVPVNSDNYNSTTLRQIESETTTTAREKVEITETTVPADKSNVEATNYFYVESADEVNIYVGYGDEIAKPNINLVTENVGTVETQVVTAVPVTEPTTIETTQTTTSKTIETSQTTMTKPVTEQLTTSQTTQVTAVQTEQVTTVQQVYEDIDLKRFEQLTDALLKELNAHNIVKLAGKKFTKADLYSTVYIYNIDFIDEDLKQQLIANNYIADDIATILVNAASVRDAVSTYNQNLLLYNTNIDELCFGFNYFKDDSEIYGELIDDEGVYHTFDYNRLNKVSKRINEKLKNVDIDEYFEARDSFYASHKTINMPFVKYAASCDEKPKMFEGAKPYQINDFADISVGINDLEAKNNVYNSLKIAVDASLDNSKAYKTLCNYYAFCIADKTCTTLTDCGAGATFAINTNILSYTRFINYNEHKTMQGFAKDNKEYKQFKVKYATIEEVIQELNDVVKIHETCSKKLTK